MYGGVSSKLFSFLFCDDKKCVIMTKCSFSRRWPQRLWAKWVSMSLLHSNLAIKCRERSVPIPWTESIVWKCFPQQFFCESSEKTKHNQWLIWNNLVKKINTSTSCYIEMFISDLVHVDVLLPATQRATAKHLRVPPLNSTQRTHSSGSNG